jgi:hypothetical protein
MAEYIEREAAEDAVGEAHLKGLNPLWELRDVPAADVAPVVHGEWVRPHWKGSDYCCDCSECDGEAMHREYQWNKKGIYPICPNCGAKMDGGNGNEV